MFIRYWSEKIISGEKDVSYEGPLPLVRAQL